LGQENASSQLDLVQFQKLQQQKNIDRRLVIVATALLTALSVLVIIYFWEEIENARRYGYWGALFISVLGGITIVPAPSFLVIFTLGHVLDPIRIGAISGIGEAIGGITVYLTGAGGKNIWSRFYSREQFVYDEVSSSFQKITSSPKGFRARYQKFYSWVEKQMQRRGSMAIFASAAIIMGPYYPVGLAAGSLRIGLKKFFLLSWAGKTVKGMTVAFAGYFGLHVITNWIEWFQNLPPAPPSIGGLF
jgi:membrane protein YqaA with SNARE-associated domain